MATAILCEHHMFPTPSNSVGGGRTTQEKLWEPQCVVDPLEHLMTDGNKSRLGEVFVADAPSSMGGARRTQHTLWEPNRFANPLLRRAQFPKQAHRQKAGALLARSAESIARLLSLW